MWKVLVGLVVLFMLGFSVFGEHGLFKLVQYRSKKQLLLHEAEKLRAENERLKTQIEQLKTDRGYLERLAREKLGMIRPGEYVIQFTEPQGTPSPSPP